jgi:O-antigen ligase
VFFAFLFLLLVLIIPVRAELVRWPAATRALLWYLAWSAVSILWTGAASTTSAVGYWATLALEVMLVGGLVLHGRWRTVAHSFFQGMICSAVLVALVAFLHAPGTWDGRLGTDVALHPNGMAQLFAPAALCAMYLVASATSRMARWMALFPLLFLYFALLRTVSKTTIIAFLVAAVWYVLGVGASRRTKAMALVIGLVGAILMWAYVEEHLTAYLQPNQGEQLLQISGRTVIWEAAVESILQRPLFGWGFLSFRDRGPQWFTLRMDQAHNEVIQQWFALGIVGLALAISIYVGMWRHLRRLKERPTWKAESRLGMALFLFYLTMCLAEAQPTGLMLPPWFLVLFLAAGGVPSAHSKNGRPSAGSRPHVGAGA